MDDLRCFLGAIILAFSLAMGGIAVAVMTQSLWLLAVWMLAIVGGSGLFWRNIV